jgi:hypothetical protein
MSLDLDLRPPMFQKHIFKKGDFGIVICFEWRIKSNVSTENQIFLYTKKYILVDWQFCVSLI